MAPTGPCLYLRPPHEARARHRRDARWDGVKKTRPLQPRDLIVDSCGREAIVLSRADTPAQRWIEKQKDPRVRDCSNSPWWNVIPLSGGTALSPEQLSKRIRVARRDDVRAAAACAMPAGMTLLVALFPEHQTAPFVIGRDLIAKSPIRSLRFRLERGDPRLAEASVRAAEMLVVDFVERVISATEPAVILAALREVVVALNGLLGGSTGPGASLSGDERDRLIAFLVDTAHARGLPVQDAEAATQACRTG